MKRLMESLRSENYSSWAERIGEMQVAPVLNIITISTMQRSTSSPQILVMIREWNADCRPRGNFTLLSSSSHHYYYDSDDQEESMWGMTTASRNLTRLSCRDMEEMWSVVITIERSLSLLLSLQIQLLLSLSLFRPKVRPNAQLRRAGALPLNLLNSLTHSLLCHKVGGK